MQQIQSITKSLATQPRIYTYVLWYIPIYSNRTARSVCCTKPETDNKLQHSKTLNSLSGHPTNDGIIIYLKHNYEITKNLLPVVTTYCKDAHNKLCFLSLDRVCL